MDRINNKNITEEELNNNIELFLEKISESKINPKAVSLTYSPVYLQKKYKENIKQFFDTIKNS